MFKAHKLQAGRERVDFLMQNSKKVPHPQYPRNKEMMMYKVLKSMLVGSRQSLTATTSVSAHGSLQDAGAASALMESMEAKRAMIESGKDGNVEKAPKDRRVPKQRTEEEIAAAQAKAAERERKRKVENAIKEIVKLEKQLTDVSEGVMALGGYANSKQREALDGY
eukprot:643457-Karenia_brevis.AAC.1